MRSIAARGNMPIFWHMRVVDTSAENTWHLSDSDSRWRTLRCSTTMSRIPSSTALLIASVDLLA